MTGPVYLDYNATTPVAPEVAQAIRPFLHEAGWMTTADDLTRAAAGWIAAWRRLAVR
jgi:cysteine sulfinate desulfinase/cysteine desulfurase-like protein